MSVLPPAPNGTTIVTGRAGQSSARTGPPIAATVKRADTINLRSNLRGILITFVGPSGFGDTQD